MIIRRRGKPRLRFFYRKGKEMNINGKEIRFKATIGAVIQIAEMCPGGDVNRVQELVKGMNAQSLKMSVKLISILSDGSLTEDELLGMDVNELQEMLDTAFDAFKRDQKPTVEVDVKKDEATEAE